jgi:spore photoproduct lyase
MVPFRPDRIWVHEPSWADPCTSEIIERLPQAPVSTIADVDAMLPLLNNAPDPHAAGKRTLLLSRYSGRFMKECPGSGAELCCNYFVLNYASNCHLECTYCVLQSYLNNPALTIFTNIEQLMMEVRDRLCAAPDRSFRIGTGELADSLALDDVTQFSRRLAPFFGTLPNATLELKTKSDCVANLQGLDHRGRTIVSWSLNPRKIIDSEELKTASLDRRLEAARRCQQWGYRVGFHFDPLIHYDGWEQGYEETVRELFERVDPAQVAWISLGGLRFTPHLRDIVRRRFPKSKIPYGEFVPGHHGKLRYFRPIREAMYGAMKRWIEQYAPQVFVYLCMESRIAWERGFGCAPADAVALSDEMDARAKH